MRTLSAFQLLPSHIIPMIVDHVACNSRLDYDGVMLCSDRGRELQMPLLWVCHNFRDFVYMRYCKSYGLYLSDTPGKVVVERCSWPKRLRKVDHETNLLAEKLTIGLGIHDVYSGKSLQLLSQAPYVGCTFPQVRSVYIFASTGKGSGSTEEYPPNTAANIVAFVNRIKEMVPRTCDVGLEVDDRLQKLLQRQDAYLVELIKRLFGIAGTTTISFHDSLKLGCIDMKLDCIDRDDIRNLVRLECYVERQQDTVLSLIRLNARTLQNIDIHAFNGLNLAGLIQDPDDGKYLEYPCLHRFKLVSPNYTLPPKPSAPEGVVPFPYLRALHLRCDYPFGDDVVFRGNSSTLEYLALGLSPKLVEVLGRFKTFTSTSHPKLGCVRIDEHVNFSWGVFDSAGAYLRFALSIAPGASVRVVPNLSRYSVDSSTALSHFYGYASIQVLHLAGTDISLLGAIGLIQSLPLLSDILVNAPTLGELSESFKEDELPDYVRTTYAPMGERFRCLQVYNDCDYIELATCMLLLALICPNFDYVAVLGGYRAMLMEPMREKIEGPLFSNYAPRLRRLLFNGWQG